MKTVRILSASMALLASASVVSHAQSEPRVFTPQSEERPARADNDVPGVQVWLDDRTYRYNDLIRPHVVADPDAFITVFRVTSDGELTVLYPARPDQQQRYSPNRFANDWIPVSGQPAFYVREGTGNGFVFAVASYYKFNYGYYTNRGQWSIGRLASASRFGSPFQIVRSFVEEITEGSSSYSMDYVMYDVNANEYRSRYATRYRGYAYDDYYGLCVNAFGYYYDNSCRGYYGGYYAPGVVVINPGKGGGTAGQRKSMRVRPLTVDPIVPGAPQQPAPAEGRIAGSDAREQAAIARHERMLRDVKPRVNPMEVERRAAPEPRVYRTQEPVVRSAPRPEPRAEAPRQEPRAEPRHIEAPRQMPSAPARVEVRNDPPRQAPPPPAVKASSRPPKDN
jgi:hypothetical protein